MNKAFPVVVLGFTAYNSGVIAWEMSKAGNTICAKCAYTRLALGVGLAAWALWLLVGDSCAKPKIG